MGEGDFDLCTSSGEAGPEPAGGEPADSHRSIGFPFSVAGEASGGSVNRVHRLDRSDRATAVPFRPAEREKTLDSRERPDLQRLHAATGKSIQLNWAIWFAMMVGSFVILAVGL